MFRYFDAKVAMLFAIAIEPDNMVIMQSSIAFTEIPQPITMFSVN